MKNHPILSSIPIPILSISVVRMMAFMGEHVPAMLRGRIKKTLEFRVVQEKRSSNMYSERQVMGQRMRQRKYAVIMHRIILTPTMLSDPKSARGYL